MEKRVMIGMEGEAREQTNRKKEGVTFRRKWKNMSPPEM